MHINKLVLAVIGLAFTSAASFSEQSAEEVAKSLANPNTPLASLKTKFQYQAFEGDLLGADDESSTKILFQPSLPFPLANGGKIIFRPAIPVMIEQPVFEASTADFDGESGLGDTGYDVIYAQTSDSGWLTGIGVVGSAPTFTYNHEGDEATIPVSLNFGKTIIANGRPWKLGVEVNYYVEQPDQFGPDWMISFEVAPVVENVIANWFK
jgi:hypothetical protein